MEARRQPSRRVRDEALVRKDEESAAKVTKKRVTPDSSETAVKKQKKTKAGESSASEPSIPKKEAKATAKKKTEEPSSDANGDSKKEASSKAKKSSKSKTDEDVKPIEKDSKEEPKESRRSGSAEPTSSPNGTKQKDDAVVEEPVAAKKGRGKKAAAEPAKVEEEEEKSPKANGRGKRGSPSEEAEAPAVKKGRGAKKAASKETEVETANEDQKAESEAQEEAAEKEEKSPKTGKKLLNNVDTNYSDIDFGIKEKFNFKITSWNVAGLRALVKKNPDYFSQENADIICMNEIKCGSLKEIPDEYKVEGYHAYWNMGKSAGGVGLLSKVEPIQVTFDLPNTDFSDEKRAITAEFEKFFVVSVYVVNSGRGLKTLEKRLEWNEAFDAYVQELDKKKPVIITGDMNVSHQEIDLANPKTNKKNAGFTQEERDGFTKLLSLGFVDSFRHFYPELTDAYTFWSYMNNARSKNVGWRLDYYLVSERFMKHVKDNVIRSTVLGSDHCPIVLFLNL